MIAETEQRPRHGEVWSCPSGGSVRIAYVGGRWRDGADAVEYRWTWMEHGQEREGKKTSMLLPRFLKRFSPPVPAGATA